MKLSKLKKIVFIFLLLFSFSFSVTADSGWDTDYGGGYDFGGGDYDYGGVYDYDYDYDYDDYDYDTGNRTYNHNSVKDDNDFFQTIMFYLILALIIYSIFKDVVPSKSNPKIKKIKYNDISLEQLQTYLPNEDMTNLKNMAINNFIKIQNAWSAFDYEALRKLCTDELYNTYITQLNVLKMKEQQNIMTDFKTLDIKLINIKKENDIVTLVFYLDIVFFDYVIDKSQKIVRGNNIYKVNNQYYLHFVKTKDTDDKMTNCPNCGAPIENVGSQTCTYCESVIIKESTNFVLSKKMKTGV